MDMYDEGVDDVDYDYHEDARRLMLEKALASVNYDFSLRVRITNASPPRTSGTF
jgi:hypothetical protein